MKEGYLRLLEEHKQKENVNLFQKVLTMTKRAKSLYSLEDSARSSLKHKPTFQAILENHDGRLTMTKPKTDISEEDSSQG